MKQLEDLCIGLKIGFYWDMTPCKLADLFYNKDSGRNVPTSPPTQNASHPRRQQLNLQFLLIS